MLNLCNVPNSDPRVRVRAAQKMTPEGTAPRRNFSSILNSRSVVFSQSTELAGRYRLLGAGEPHPKSKSKS